MEYTLMHKDIPVLNLDLDEATSSVRKILAAYHPEHLPLGTASKHGDTDRAALNAWWIDRSIPAGRSGIRRALETLELPNTQMLLTRCFGLSLSDQYWVKPRGSDLQWERVNFFTNPFSEDIGNVLLGKVTDHAAFDFRSPDTEFVSAWRVMQSVKKDNSTSVYRHYLNCCEALGIPGMERVVDQMIVLDYPISNEDRHQNNFGLIREVFDQAGEYMDESRKFAILSAFSSRLGNLMALSEVQRPMDDIEQDVEQDVAQDYGMKMDQ